MASSADAALELTGERTLPGIWHERYWFGRHLVAYEHAVRVARRHLARRRSEVSAPPRVLDAGCGEGYGAALLTSARIGAQVVGLDYDATTAAHVRSTYPVVAMVRGNLVELPLRSGVFAVVVSLQTVEHLWDQPSFASECARVLARDGLLVVSTPNRLTFSPDAPNPFHSCELDPDGLMALLRPNLAGLEVLGVHHGPRLRAFAQSYGDPVAAQLATPPDTWDTTLAGLVASVGPDDFEIVADRADRLLVDALDLVAVGTTAPDRGRRA